MVNILLYWIVMSLVTLLLLESSKQTLIVLSNREQKIALVVMSPIVILYFILGKIILPVFALILSIVEAVLNAVARFLS